MPTATRPMARILIVDDEDAVRAVLSEVLDGPDRVLLSAATVAEAHEMAAMGPIDVALVDKNLPDGSGLEFVSWVKRAQPNLEAIVITAYASLESAMEAVQLQLFDYVTKPFDDIGRVEILVQNALDKVALVRREARLHRQVAHSEERYALALEATSDGIWDWNLVTNEIYLSPRWKGMLGFGEQDLVESPDTWFSRVHGDDRQKLRRDLASLLEGKETHFDSEYRMTHRGGQAIWVRNHAVCVRKNGSVVRMVGAQSDVTKRKEMEAQLLHDALHDALTGLPNRVLFMDRLEHALRNAKRREGRSFAVVFIDLDRFKNVNDSLGHLAGDELLVALAHRLAECNGRGDTLARLGGDEFAILVEDVRHSGQVTALVQEIEEALQEPVPIRDTSLVVTASIGIAIGDGQYERAEDILRDADTAMYRAKASGKARHEVFVGDMRAAVVKFLQVENDLRQALQNGEFVVYYQPILQLKPFLLVGFEALVRWKHPQQGLVSPLDFIPVAEETGFIVELGELVLREACQQLAIWRRTRNQELYVSVNLSPRQFTHAELVPMVAREMRQAGIPPEALRLEVTEGVLISDTQRAEAVLDQLKAMGIALYLDDFGTGFSSMSYLHRLPFDTLKIDRSFVSRLTTEPKSRGLVGGIITMAHALGIHVVAEGIETHEQFDLLRELGCELGQGYYFARPLPAEHASELIQTASPTDIRELVGAQPAEDAPAISYEHPLTGGAKTTLDLLRELLQLREEFKDETPT